MLCNVSVVKLPVACSEPSETSLPCRDKTPRIKSEAACCSALALCRSLKPWRHYAPFHAGADAGDQVIALVEHLEKNDKKARAMADEAQHWAYR